MKNHIVLPPFAIFFIGLVDVAAQEGQSVGVAGGVLVKVGWARSTRKRTRRVLTLNRRS
jgi:hypothetical protein